MIKIILIAILVIAAIIGVPLATIWSLNTLFPVLSIPYTIWTWLAAFFLVSLGTKSGLSFKA
jgi:hypothetical protein